MNVADIKLEENSMLFTPLFPQVMKHFPNPHCTQLFCVKFNNLLSRKNCVSFQWNEFIIFFSLSIYWYQKTCSTSLKLKLAGKTAVCRHWPLPYVLLLYTYIWHFTSDRVVWQGIKMPKRFFDKSPRWLKLFLSDPVGINLNSISCGKTYLINPQTNLVHAVFN